MPDPITDLDEVRRLAQEHRGRFDLLRAMLERSKKLNDARFDAYVETTAAPIIAAIDCTKCANCCRSLDVYLIEEDAKRLSEGLMIPLIEIETRYVDQEAAAEEEEWGLFRQRPCAFLDGKLCSVYAHRPESCRIYPAFTPDFRWTLEDTIEGSSICPIIYNVLTALCDRLLPRG
ncbi:MAG: YkgJ family cysteine cluster protein [Chloroflexota bacterium]